MKVTYPLMGNLNIGLRALFKRLEIQVIEPPPISQRTLALGIAHSPEFACFPFKVNLGNFLEALEGGADTIVVAGGRGPCRFGYYGQVQAQILRDLGEQFQCITVESLDSDRDQFFLGLHTLANGHGRLKIAGAIYFAYRKLQACDEAERLAGGARPREMERGETDAVYRWALERIDRADDLGDLRAARAEVRRRFKRILRDPARCRLRIGIIGEIFFVTEPFVNQHLERRLGEMGVEVKRTIYLSDWILHHLLLSRLGLDPGRHYRREALPYLRTEIGGHAMENLGRGAQWARQGYDGLIQVAPFTCMPELVGRSILPVLGSELGIPVLSLFMDEQAGEAGLQTRLEAFVDLVQRRKQKQPAQGRRWVYGGGGTEGLRGHRHRVGEH